MSHIFVSHSSKDDTLVSEIHDALLANGCDLWVDHVDIKPGTEWQPAIDAALAAASDMIVCISRHSITSAEVTAEWRDALLRGVRLIPVVLDDIPLLDIPSRLRLIEPIRLHGDKAGGMARLLAAFTPGVAPTIAHSYRLHLTGHIERNLTAIPLQGRAEALARCLAGLNGTPVCISGVGGKGKSRLAAEVVATADGYSGVVWHRIREFYSADELLSDLRLHLELDGATAEAALLKHLRGVKTLVIIDNGESASVAARVSYARLIEELVAAGAGVVITSRERWRELDPSIEVPLDTLSDADAQAVVREMARVYNVPGNVAGQAVAIAAAARNHPRLIETALKQAKHLPLAGVIDNLKVLRGIEFETALAKMIDISFVAMTAKAGAAPLHVLQRMSVTRGGFTYAAAMALCVGTPNGVSDASGLSVGTPNGVSVTPNGVSDKTANDDNDGSDAPLPLPDAPLPLPDAPLPLPDVPLPLPDVPLPLPDAPLPLPDAPLPLPDVPLPLPDVPLPLPDVPLPLPDAPLRVPTTLLPDGDALDMALVALTDWQFVSFDGVRYRLDPLAAEVAERDLARAPFMASTPTDHAANPYRAHYTYYEALARDHDQRQAYAALDPDSENLEAAFEWAMRVNIIAAYRLANACSFFLANRGRFARRMDWFMRLQAALAGHSDETFMAGFQHDFAIVLKNHPFGSRRDNLRRAITAYQVALVYYTPETAPLAYAMTQNNLGEAYRNLASVEDRAANLGRAIAAYQAALLYSTPEAAPLDYAATQNNLGAAYRNLASVEDRAANLGRAIAAFQAALVYRTPAAAPLAYAMTQNNLGAAYQNLASVEDRAANLGRAIAAYQAALVYRTPDSAPLAYAMTQYNLGAAYGDLASVEDRTDLTPNPSPERRGELLQRAIAAYQAALVYYTPDSAPLAYAMTQHNLGIAHEDSGDLRAAVACWREAERYYRLMEAVEDADEMLAWIGEVEAELGDGRSPGNELPV